jgi:hypothetical protein
VPKPPEALAERSRAILTSLGHTDHAADSTYSFITVQGTGRSRLRFLYRESPLPLVPQNLFHVVTASDPPLDLGGMATVTLDTSGQLIVFSRFIDSADERNRGVTPSTMFAEAGLSEGDFVAITPARRPAVPHDSAMAWVRGEDANKIRVSSATLGGAPVYFEVAGAGAAVGRSRVFSTRRTPTAEALLSLVIVAWLASTSVMARHNLRAGESDVTGAFKLSLFTFAAGVSAAMLRSHHVANPVDEVILLLGAGGWCLVFAALNWLSYVSFEPHVRRLWPRTLISWARLLSGRFRDPLVGRDVLVGIFGGVVLAVSMLLRFRVTGANLPNCGLVQHWSPLGRGGSLRSRLATSCSTAFNTRWADSCACCCFACYFARRGSPPRAGCPSACCSLPGHPRAARISRRVHSPVSWR